MTEGRIYKEAERHEYDPGRCPKCDSADVALDWQYVGIPGEDAWLPGMQTCRNPQCPGRPQMEDFFS